MNALSRIHRSDFFSVLLPGYYLLMVVAFALDVWTNGATDNIWSRSMSFFAQNPTNWFLILASIIVAYLLGSLVRALPVNWADQTCRVFQIFPTSKFTRRAFEDHFPYRKLIKRQLKALQNCQLKDLPDVLLPPRQTTHTMYNVWKLFLCKTSPVVFVYVQALESRVRLFAGMFWTGTVGAVVFAGLAYTSDGRFWWGVASSAILAASFGYNLRRARVQEVIHVFLAVAMIHNLSGTAHNRLTFAKQRRPPPKRSPPSPESSERDSA